MTPMALTLKEVDHIASLARLRLTDAAEVLSPAQRAKLAQQFERFHH